MGGNALKVAFTRRYTKTEYNDIKRNVSNLLKQRDIISAVPKSFYNKDSFGDLDILVKASTINGNIVTTIKELFNPKEIYKNTSVISFDYKEFQVDIIVVKDKYWETSYQYYSWNDLGNLIGRISYKMGFRYGHFGLKLVVRHPDGGNKFEKIISKDINKILDFLGFNVDWYQKGFYNVEDIFDFVISSKYFSPKYFALKELNHQNRTRNKKRKVYTKFLEYIEEKTTGMIFFGIEYTKEEWIEIAENFFNIDLNSEISEWKSKINIMKNASNHFNGKDIINKFGITGKELGQAISTYKSKVNEYLETQIDNMSYHEYILKHDKKELLNEFGKINKLK